MEATREQVATSPVAGSLSAFGAIRITTCLRPSFGIARTECRYRETRAVVASLVSQLRCRCQDSVNEWSLGPKKLLNDQPRIWLAHTGKGSSSPIAAILSQTVVTNRESMTFTGRPPNPRSLECCPRSPRQSLGLGLLLSPLGGKAGHLVLDLHDGGPAFSFTNGSRTGTPVGWK